MLLSSIALARRQNALDTAGGSVQIVSTAINDGASS